MNWSFDYETMSFSALVKIFIVIFAMPIHNLTQAYIAEKFGDSTAIEKGFNTLNPSAHVNFRSILAFLVVGISWTVHVPRSFSKENTKNPRLAEIITTLSGPFSYLILSVFFMIAARIVYPANIPRTLLLSAGAEINSHPVYVFLVYVALFLIQLFLIQFIPIRPFDGNDLICQILPGKIYYKFKAFLERFEGIVAIVCLLFFASFLFSYIQLASTQIFLFVDKLILSLIETFLP